MIGFWKRGEVQDWLGTGDRAGATGKVGDGDRTTGELGALFAFGSCTASNMPLLTSSWTVSMAELFPTKSLIPM